MDNVLFVLYLCAATPEGVYKQPLHVAINQKNLDMGVGITKLDMEKVMRTSPLEFRMEGQLLETMNWHRGDWHVQTFTMAETLVVYRRGRVEKFCNRQVETTTRNETRHGGGLAN